MCEANRVAKNYLGPVEDGPVVGETRLGQQVGGLRGEAGVGPVSMPVDTAEAQGSFDDNGSEEMDEEVDDDEGVAGPITTLPRPAPVPRQPMAYTVRAADLSCLICLEPFRDPFVTKCGHTFCFECLQRQLKIRNQCPCPQCRGWLIEEQAYPNKFVQQLLAKVVPSGPINHQTPLQKLRALLDNEDEPVHLEDVTLMLHAVWEKQQQLEEREKEFNLGLLTRFLEHAKQQKEQQLRELQEQVQILDADLQTVKQGGLTQGGRAQKRTRSDAVQLYAAAGSQPVRGPSVLPSQLPGGPMSAVSRLAEGSMQPQSRSTLETRVPEPNHEFRQSLSNIAAYKMWRGKKEPLRAEEAVGDSKQASAAYTDCRLGADAGAGPSCPDVRAEPTTADEIPVASSHDGPSGEQRLREGLEDAMERGLSDSDVSNDSLSDQSASDDESLDGSGMDSDAEELLREQSRAQRKRVASQFDDLHQAYLAVRSRKRHAPLAHHGDLRGAGLQHGADVHSRQDGASADSSEALLEFGKVLNAFVQYSNLKVVAQISQSDPANPAILSSIEFSTEARFFATAGVSKRIKIYDFDAVMSNPHVEAHCPTKELKAMGKLSCVSWNKFVRNHIISSDYDGGVLLWDVETSEGPIHEYQAHEKRIWSVDFCNTDHMQFVSGSDDGWVKTWDSRSPEANGAINVRANVCSVKYNPSSMWEIAVGSADHFVHVYDIRSGSNGPLHVFTGHRKAVSYVKYMDNSSLVSASTDSTLRLWDVPSKALAHVYMAHVNEKNFVGLSVEGDLLACGSESNEVFVYHREMSTPIAQRIFSEPAMVPGSENSQFISAVCWKPSSHKLLAANSQGTIQIMELSAAASVEQDRMRRLHR